MLTAAAYAGTTLPFGMIKDSDTERVRGDSGHHLLLYVHRLPYAGIALAVRRLHDSDRSGWWWWIGWVPLAGWIVLLWFYLLPRTRDTNRYSPPSAFTRRG